MDISDEMKRVVKAGKLGSARRALAKKVKEWDGKGLRPDPVRVKRK